MYSITPTIRSPEWSPTYIYKSTNPRVLTSSRYLY